MKAIIIGAGKGERLMPHTQNSPKCFAEVKGKRILDWGLEALHAGGLEEVVFVGGYRINSVREEFPEFTYCDNSDWKDNNILVSLFYAEPHMEEGFVCAYSDILYSPEIIKRLMKSPFDVTLVCDVAWRNRYIARTEHPEWDAEKIAADGDRILGINRTMQSEEAVGEYIGLTRFTSEGARILRRYFHMAREQHHEGSFQGARSFKKAYLIDLYQEMISAGNSLHLLETKGGYMEIDTNQDFKIARAEWTG